MTTEPTPETDDFRPCHLTPSDWPWFARGMEIERNAARADVAQLRAELADERAKKSDALIAAVQDIERLTAERDAARIPICVGQPIIQILANDGLWAIENGNSLVAADSLFRQDPFAERDAARADAARLRDALEKMLIAEMEVRQMVGFSADEVETEPHWMAARAALDTPAQ